MHKITSHKILSQKLKIKQELKILVVFKSTYFKIEREHYSIFNRTMGYTKELSHYFKILHEKEADEECGEGVLDIHAYCFYN